MDVVEKVGGTTAHGERQANFHLEIECESHVDDHGAAER